MFLFFLFFFLFFFFFFSSRRRHTRSKRDWSSDVCSSDLRRATLLRDERLGRGRTLAYGRLPVPARHVLRRRERPPAHDLEPSGDRRRAAGELVGRQA